MNLSLFQYPIVQPNLIQTQPIVANFQGKLGWQNTGAMVKLHYHNMRGFWDVRRENSTITKR